MAIPFYHEEEEENVEHCAEIVSVSEEESPSFVGQLVKELVGIYYGKNNYSGNSRSINNSRTSNRSTRTYSRRLRGAKIMDLLFLGKLRL